MLTNPFRNLRFSLKSLFILTLGIAIGYALNLSTWKLLTGPANEAAMMSLPTYVIEPPDVLNVQITSSRGDGLPVVTGQHLVGPDGRISLRAYGSVYVAGLTIAETEEAIKQVVDKKIDSPQVIVDVFAYNSKCYYIIVEDQAGNANVAHAPITGNDTALDAVAHVGGVPSRATARIWISRPAPNGVGSAKILPVDWDKVSRGASMVTNYQLLPGDRLFISQKVATTN